MKFILIEDYDDFDNVDSYKALLNRKIESVAKDIAKTLLNIENPQEKTIKNLADELKHHKETFIEMINQNENLLDEVKDDLKNKINKLRL